MYMGVILLTHCGLALLDGAPHVYGGDPLMLHKYQKIDPVLPMYMGVILSRGRYSMKERGAPHVYGGDPRRRDNGKKK